MSVMRVFTAADYDLTTSCYAMRLHGFIQLDLQPTSTKL